jgi:hypothetical protein
MQTKNCMVLQYGKIPSTPVQCHLNVKHCSYPWPDPICHRLVNNGMAEVRVTDDCVSTLSWPPTSQTVKLMFLYSTVSTLNPVKFPQALCQCYISSAPIGSDRLLQPTWVPTKLPLKTHRSLCSGKCSRSQLNSWNRIVISDPEG